MSDTKFTPGPWDLSRVRRSHRRVNAINWGALAKIYVKVDDSPSEEGEANASLIAAAPDLYDALSQLLDDPDNEAENRAFARRMLAKARGEPS